MALGANLTNSSAMNGAVFVKELQAGGEVHLSLYDGFMPSAVPEPSSAMMILPAAIGFFCWLRRRK
jgi:hypothetical protein